MVREVLTVQIGQCGIRTGAAYWDLVRDEHNLNEAGYYLGRDHTKGDPDDDLAFIESHMHEVGTQRYAARSVLVDTESGAIDDLMAGRTRGLFRPGTSRTANSPQMLTYARGMNGEGQPLVAETLDVIRVQAEACDSLEAFQLCCSTSGGTGSGLSSALTLALKEQYPRQTLVGHAVLPGNGGNESVIENLNTMLCLQSLCRDCDMILWYDNPALLSCCYDRLQISNPSLLDANKVMAQAMANLTCEQRFGGLQNATFRKLAACLVVFPECNIFYPSLYPLIPTNQLGHSSANALNAGLEAFANDSSLASVNSSYGRYLCVTTIFRGPFMESEVEGLVIAILNKTSSYFVEWVPSNIQPLMCKRSPLNWRYGCTMVGCSTASMERLKQISEVATPTLYDAKDNAITAAYEEYGITMQDIISSESALNDLISQMQSNQDATAEDYNYNDNNDNYD